MADAGLHLALLLFGGVVVAVLGEITELAGGLDLASDVGATVRSQVLELGLQPVVGFLGQMVGLGHVGHRSDHRRCRERQAKE